jgi:DNA-binding FadR family transcriptional regulator
MDNDRDTFRLSVPTLQSLPTDSRAEQIAQQMTEFIGMGLLAPGARLPSESDLATQFGVSTVTLREALAMLRQRGLVTTRRGRGGGSFIQEPLPPPTTDGAAALAGLGLDELQDQLDYSAAIQAATAHLAASRAGPTELKRLRTAIDNLANARTDPNRRRADAGFHIELGAASHSTLLTREEIELRGEISGLVWLVPGRDPDRDRVLSEHEAIVDAIAARDPEAARLAADQHAAADARVLIGWRLAHPDAKNPVAS